MQQRPPLTPRGAQGYPPLSRQGQAHQGGQEGEPCGYEKHDLQPLLRGRPCNCHQSAGCLEGIENPGKKHYQKQKAQGSPNPNKAEGISAGGAERPQGYGDRHGNDGRGKNRQRSGGKQNGRKTARQAEQHVACGSAKGEKGQNAASRPAPVRHLTPEDLRKDLYQRDNGENYAHLGAAEAGILLEIEAVIGKENPLGAQIEKPEEREGGLALHEPASSRYVISWPLK